MRIHASVRDCSVIIYGKGKCIMCSRQVGLALGNKNDPEPNKI